MVGNCYNNFVNCARGIPGFVVGQKEDVPYDITELMNGYCQAKDEHNNTKMSQYISALYVRYWHMAVMLYQQSTSTRLDFDDILFWMYDAFEKAAKYRSWMDSSKAVSKDPKGAEKCINQCITSIRQYWYKHFNQDKRKVNYITSSLNDFLPRTSFDDTPVQVVDTIESKDEEAGFNDYRCIVQDFIDRGQLFEAFVLDGILYQDCFLSSYTSEKLGKDEEGQDIEVIHYKTEFSSVKLNKHLRNMSSEFIDSFVSKYSVELNNVIDVVKQINLLTKSQFSKKINAAFELFKNNEEIKTLLCM